MKPRTVKEKVEYLMKLYLLADDYKKLNFKWNGWDVYDPIYHQDIILGTPSVIMVKGKQVRVSTIKESFDILDFIQKKGSGNYANKTK